jgi:hypothetical protein
MVGADARADTAADHSDSVADEVVVKRDAQEPRVSGANRRFLGCSSDGAYRDRTGDLRLAKPALSQLS